MQLKVSSIDAQFIHCGPWKFDRQTGAEIDEDLDWNAKQTGSRLIELAKDVAQQPPRPQWMLAAAEKIRHLGIVGFEEQAARIIDEQAPDDTLIRQEEMERCCRVVDSAGLDQHSRDMIIELLQLTFAKKHRVNYDAIVEEYQTNRIP